VSRSTISGHFIDGAKGPIFVLLRRPPGPSKECVLVVPPFGEEMNKCRRMVTEVALGLAERGIATVIPDLYGTGDSCGDFVEGDWVTWRADLSAASRWSACAGHPVSSVLAIRLGCALALDGICSSELAAPAKSVLWQPIFDGGRFLAQFLRLRVAASLMEDRKESLAELRTRLAAGTPVEVAGYNLAGRLAEDLEALAPPDYVSRGALGALAWFEVIRGLEGGVSPASAKLIESTRGHGGSVESRTFSGEPFWSTTEIVVNRDLVLATVAHLAAA